jgi:N-acetylglucosaminyl-diphospho-decaprenol L-rhamnosyltransferase
MFEYDLTIIVVAWNVVELLDECFASIRKSDDSYKKQIILVDNGSKDNTIKFVKKNYPEVEIIESPTNLGFIRANNLAYKYVKGEYILMLNSDAFVFPESIRLTMDFIKGIPDAGVVGARLIGRDGVLQPSARYFPTPFRTFLVNLGLDGKIPFFKPIDDLTWDHKTVIKCDWVVGCYLLSKKSIIEKTGFFLREDYFMYNDDNDLCNRIKKLGYQVYFYPVDVIHVGGANIKKMHELPEKTTDVDKYQIESQFIYYRKNHGLFAVFSNWFFLSLYAAIEIAKKLLQPKRSGSFVYWLNNLSLISKIVIKTNFGSFSIH